jgi:hypothetical protein
MIAAYAAGALAVVCFAGALRGWFMPLAGDRLHRGSAPETETAPTSREKKQDTDAPSGEVSATAQDSPHGQAIGQIGPGGIVFGPNASLPNAVFNLGSEKDRNKNSLSAQAEQGHGVRTTRSDEKPPKLKARLVPFEGQSRQYAYRLEVKIVSSEPLMNIVVILPYGDRRLMGGGNWLQARHFGDSLLQPGRWLPFEGLVHLTAQTFTGKVEATANCISEYGKRWDNFPIRIAFAEFYE